MFWVIIIAIVALFIWANWPKYCNVCGTEIKRVSYVWNVEGKRQRMCPNCNRRMENRKSKNAFASRFGSPARSSTERDDVVSEPWKRRPRWKRRVRGSTPTDH